MTTSSDIILSARNISVSYQGVPAVQGVNLDIHKHQVTSFIGPSGCGKSTILRCFNRLNDLIRGVKISGQITLAGENLMTLHPAAVRRRVGMVFQRPNPFPNSVYDNIALGLRVNGYRGNIDDRVEESLRRAWLWEEVKDQLKRNALALSGGQQQRLCIARAIALHPEVLLMDEPCSALDPIATMRINELIQSLRQELTVVIVTHNLQQAAYVSDYTAFFSTNEQRIGQMVEFGVTYELFRAAQEQRTLDYIEGRL
ncbi:MAG TPA: phosphate ABC transporter ATP-binding protein [Chroococcidiopsis sp.]